MEEHALATYHFGEFRLDQRRTELQRAGTPVPLQPKIFDLLVYLIQNRDRPVSKQELFEALWPGVVVSDAALTSAVRDLRVALRDRARPRWAIRTLPRRGYRFVAPVRAEKQAPSREELARRARSVFVGREDVLARLDSALGAVLGGLGRIVLVAGEPGIGKTRCIQVFAELARTRGVDVHEAWCHQPDGVPPYWPWLQLLRSVRGATPEAFRSLRAPMVQELAVLMPEIGTIAPAFVRVSDSAHARLRLFEAVSACLEQAAAVRPLLLWFDDLHAADRSSLRLLHFVARRTRRAPMLVVASFRDREASSSLLFSETLSELMRAAPVERTDLIGLEVGSVEDWLRQLGEDRAEHVTPERLVRLTAGNPLFIEQLLFSRASDPTTAAPQAPHSLRHLVRERIHGLSRRCCVVLEAASALGGNLEPDLLCAVAGLDRAPLEEALREARDAYIVREDTASGCFRFANPLIQETVYAEQTPSERARWHRRAAVYLGAHPGSRNAEPSALARHALGSLPTADAVDVARHVARAGRRSMEQRAFDEARAYFERALAILDEHPDADPRALCELLLACGEAQAATGEYHPSGRGSFLRAARVARRHAWPELFARAALGVGELSHEIATEDGVLIELLETSLDLLGEGDEALRGRVTARLALELPRRHSEQRPRQLAERAAVLGQRAGDDAALGQALLARLLHLWVPEALEERRTTAREIVRMGRAQRDPALELWGHNALVASALEAGSRADWEAAVNRYVRLAVETQTQPHRSMATLAEILAALVGGRLAEAERLLSRARAAPAPDASPLAGLNLAIQLQWLRLLRDDPVPRADIEMLSTATLPSDYANTALSIAAFLHAERGDAGEARKLLEELATDDFTGLPRNMFWLLSLVLLLRVCLRLGDLERAVRLEAQLRPFASHRVGLSFHYFGSVQHTLGALASARGRWDEAVADLEGAVASEESLGAHPFAALARADLARGLLGRDRPGDRTRARRLLRTSREEAASMGLRDPTAEREGLGRAPVRLRKPPSLRRARP